MNVNQKVDYERQCRRTLAKNDLIASILNFDADSLVEVNLARAFSALKLVELDCAAFLLISQFCSFLRCAPCNTEGL